MTEPLPSPNLEDASLQEQVLRSQQNIKAFRFIGEKILKHRDKDYDPNVPRFTGQIDAYQTLIAKIETHISGIRKMHVEGALTDDECNVALRWTNEVLGIPANLVEIAKINLRRAEGAVVACNTQLEDINTAIKSEQANIRRLETVGERVDDLAQRKREAKVAKAEGSPPDPKPEVLSPPPLQTTA